MQEHLADPPTQTPTYPPHTHPYSTHWTCYFDKLGVGGRTNLFRDWSPWRRFAAIPGAFQKKTCLNKTKVPLKVTIRHVMWRLAPTGAGFPTTGSVSNRSFYHFRKMARWVSHKLTLSLVRIVLNENMSPKRYYFQSTHTHNPLHTHIHIHTRPPPPHSQIDDPLHFSYMDI